MPRSRLLAGLAVLAVAAVLIAVVSLWRRSPEPPPVESFSFDNVSVESPDLDVAADGVRGELRGSYMDWACLLRCQESAGCHAEIMVTVHYRSSGNERQIVFSSSINVADGSRFRVGGVQRPPQAVDAVDRIEVDVERVFRPGEPSPTPEY